MADGELALGAVEEVVDPESVESDIPGDLSADTDPELEPVPEPEPQKEPAKPQALSAKEVAKMVRELRVSHPELANQLRALNDAYFRSNRFSEIGFPTPEDSQRARATFEALGGEDGIASMRQRVDFADNIDRMAEEGDPKIVDSWATESPEGFKKIVPTALSRLEQLDAKAYAETLRPHLVKSLQGTGLADAINRVAWFADKTDNPDLKREIGQIQQWLGGLVDEETKRQSTQNDPRMEQINKERQSISQERAQIFDDKIRTQLQPQLDSALAASIKELSKGQKLPDGTVSDLTQAVISEIDATLGKDKVYQANLSALRAKGDIGAIVKYVKTNFDSLRPRIARDVWSKRVSPFQTNKQDVPPRREPAGGNGRPTVQPQPSSMPRLLNKPTPDQIDWSKDPDRMLFIAGRGFMKAGTHAGKMVTWKRP